eukprot:CCRYP_021040-RA/>CCRYP_021040-RA protein AED:0.48 eAED:0.82 QI:0/0/0/1/0/0/2/0/87
MQHHTQGNHRHDRAQNKCNGLCYIPIHQPLQDTFNIYNDTKTTNTHVNNSVYHTTTLAALDNDQLIGFPSITSTQARKYLPESTTTT